MTDPIIAAARFLQAHLDWLRHRSATEIQECFADIAAAARVVAGIARGPSEQKYLGPCGATWSGDPGDGPDAECNCGREQLKAMFHVGACPRMLAYVEARTPCDGDVYGRAGAATGACRTCGATVDQAERRAWLDEQVGGSDLAWTARGIADALNLNVKTVREWARPHLSDTGVVLREAKLRTYYRLGEHIVPWTDPAEGENVKARGDRLHYVGDVRKLAQESADRRETERQRRERVDA